MPSLSLLRRSLCDFLPDDRHCQYPVDQNTSASDPIFENDGQSTTDEDECVSDSDGNFGSSTDAYRELVPYLYQVQTTVDLSASALNSTVLALLEKALADLLVPDLFSGECELRQRLSKENELPIGQTALVGLLSQPDDQLVPGLAGVNCRTPLVEGADRCYLVNGGLTLQGKDNIAWALPLAAGLVKLTMNNKMLNDVHPDVVDVRFMELFDRTNSETPQVGTGGINGTTDNGTTPLNSTTTSYSAAAWPWVLLGIGLFLILAGLFAIRRRMQFLKEDNNNYTSSYDETTVTPLAATNGASHVGSASNVYSRTYLEEDHPINSSQPILLSPTPEDVPQPQFRNSYDYDDQDPNAVHSRLFI